MQTHLKGFGLENFRVFKDYTWFDFAPITILTGPNSSGKSSLNKALLLLKDNFEKGNLPPYYTLTHEGWSTTDELLLGDYLAPSTVESEYYAEYKPSTLRFDGKNHELGNLISTKCRDSYSLIMTFSIPYKININRSFIWNESEENFNEPSIPNVDYIINLIKNGYADSEKIKNNLLKSIEDSKGVLGQFKVLGQLNSMGERTILCHYTFQADKNTKSLSQLELQNDKGITFLKVDEKSMFFDLEIYDNLIANSEHKLLNIFNSYEKTIYANYQIHLETWFSENGLNKESAKQYSNRVLKVLDISFNNQETPIRFVAFL